RVGLRVPRHRAAILQLHAELRTLGDAWRCGCIILGDPRPDVRAQHPGARRFALASQPAVRVSKVSPVSPRLGIVAATIRKRGFATTSPTRWHLPPDLLGLACLSIAAHS